ncbi:MAG TPA: BNR-4 repeat-containing protein [Allosphingosinicella sp.]|nr:BNR-4 repeat-containing protein [Allosphingosinicella sp.]
MTTYKWPDGIVPFDVDAFFLEPHTGGSESPFSRSTKTYGLSKPRFITRFSVRGGDSAKWGARLGSVGPRMDAFLAKMCGRQHNVILWDFRREGAEQGWINAPIAAGASSFNLIGGAPEVGYYVGGDGRPHLVQDVVAGPGGTRRVTVDPPFERALAAGEAFFDRPWGLFKLTSDQAGSNPSPFGAPTVYTLELAEDLNEIVIEGEAAVFGVLSVDGEWETATWFADGVAIAGEDGLQLQLTTDQAGAEITALVGLERGGGILTRPTEAVADYDFAELFTGGMSGAWYDPSDLGTMWQDTAGTVPAVVDARVARIDDKSGNGNHATQATEANRPFLREGPPGYNYLEFDGTNDFLHKAFTLAQPFDRISAINPLSWTASDVLFGGGASTNANLQQSGSSPLVRITAGSAPTAITQLPTGATRIVHERWNPTASFIRLIPAPSDWIEPGTGNPGGMTIGADHNGAFNAHMAFRGALVINRLLLAHEAVKYSAYLRLKSGLASADYLQDYFGHDGATTPWYAASSHSPGAYNPRTNKALIAWEAGRSTSDARTVRCIQYDHTTRRWGGMNSVAVAPLLNDSHGVPSVCHLDDDRLFIAGGGHATDMYYWISTNQDDPASWVQGTIAGAWTYPHPRMVNGTLYLFMRSGTDSPPPGEGLPLKLVKSTSISGTTITWAAAETILDFGSNTRTYTFKVEVRGTDLHMVSTRANLADTKREDVYYLIYDTLTGNRRNLAGTYSQAGAIDLATANAQYRIVTTSVDGSTVASFCWDEVTEGVMHLAYIMDDGAYYRRFVAGVSGAATLLNTVGSRVTAMVSREEGGAEFWYADDSGSWTLGGDMRRKPIDADGTVGASELILAAGADYALAQPGEVIDSHLEPRRDLRTLFCEIMQNDLTESGRLKLYAHGEGDSGFVRRNYAI